MLITHDYKFPKVKIYNYCTYEDDLKIGEGSVICAGAVIRDNVTIGKNTIIGPNCMIESNVVIGNNVTIQPFSLITRGMTVEDDVFIGPNFACANNPYIPDGEHGTSPNKKPDIEKSILIKKGTRIGTRCTVAPGVTIGQDCFIKMNCDIYSDVPPGTTIESSSTWKKTFAEGSLIEY